MSGTRCLPKVYAGRRAAAASRACALFALVLFVYGSGLVNGMRITSMTAPAVVDLRDDLTLECKFDTGGEQLYAVKWYKDDQEFFRYKPLGLPATITFPVAGVHMREASWNCTREHCKVVLDHLRRDHSGGTYRCEVSGEAPAFRIASESHNVTAAALPIADLRVENLSNSYVEGEIVTAECISAPSDPAPILSWYINGDEAHKKYVGEMKSSRIDLHGFTSRTLSVRFAAEKKLFPNDRMEISCKSSLPGVSIRPQVVEKVISLKTQASQSAIKNQKLHWLSSSGSIRSANAFGGLWSTVALLWFSGNFIR